MKFNWTGGPVQDFTDRSVLEMQPNILYRQGGAWRLVLRPGTDAGLTFMEIDFDEDGTALEKLYKEAEAEFAHAAGRTIPVGYHAGKTHGSPREPGLIKTMINHLIG